MKTRTHIIVAAVAIVSAFAAYASVLDVALLGWDSYPIILTSKISSWSDLTGTLTEELMDGRYTDGSFYRPFTNFTFAVNHWIGELNPAVYHATDILICGIGAWLIFALARRLLGLEYFAAACAAAVFLLHPVQLEILPTAPRRADNLALVFTLLAVLNSGANTRWAALRTALFCLLAIASKETGIIALPLVALRNVLVAFSVQQSVLGERLGAIILMVVALTMLITPLLFILYDRLTHRMEEVEHDQPEDEIHEKGQVIIAGIGRFGQVVSRLVESAGLTTTVLDTNLAAVQTMRQFGFKGYFGDPTRPDLLHAAGIETADVLVVALDDRPAAIRLVSYARRVRPDLHIVARARDRTNVFELYQAGADDIVRELFDSSLRAGRYVLENLGLSEFEANRIEMNYYQHDRAALRDLAALWKPDVPLEKNAEYIARAQQLNKNLETRLTEVLDEEDEGGGPEGRRMRAPGGRSKGGT